MSGTRARPYDPHEVWTLEKLWEPTDGSDPWLVGFHFAEVEGLPACVGVTIRSYLAVPMYDARTEVDVDTWVPCPPDWNEPVPSEGDRLDWPSLGELLYRHEGMATGIHAEERLPGHPRPLTTTILRGLPFGSLLKMVMREEAGRADFVAKGLDYMATSEADVSGLHDAADGERQYAQDLKSGPKRRGRKPTRDLAVVADVYSSAVRQGRHNPTLTVANELAIPRSTAAKMVQRARRAGLLGPTEPRKAGGVPPREGEE